MTRDSYPRNFQREPISISLRNTWHLKISNVYTLTLLVSVWEKVISILHDKTYLKLVFNISLSNNRLDINIFDISYRKIVSQTYLHNYIRKHINEFFLLYNTN